jgi:hypothetical protein
MAPLVILSCALACLYPESATSTATHCVNVDGFRVVDTTP